MNPGYKNFKLFDGLRFTGDIYIGIQRVLEDEKRITKYLVFNLSLLIDSKYQELMVLELLKGTLLGTHLQNLTILGTHMQYATSNKDLKMTINSYLIMQFMFIMKANNIKNIHT